MSSLSRAARRYLLHLALLTAGLAISSLYFNLLLLELGYTERSLTLPLLGPLAMLGVLNSAPVLIAGLSSLPIWWLVSRIGPQPALIAGALLHAATLTSVALWPAPLPLLISISLAGPASVLTQVGAAPYMLRHSGPRERDMLFALSAALAITIAGIANLIGGLLPGLATSLFNLPAQGALTYRSVFLVAALLTGLAIVPLLTTEGPITPATNPTDAQAGRIPAWQTLFHALLGGIRFTLSPLLISCGAALLIPFLNLYFRQRFAATDATLGLIFAAIGISTGAATLIAPLLSRRLGKPCSIVLTQALAIPCLLLLGIAPSLWLATGLALVRGALMNMATPLYDALAMEHSTEAARPIVIGMIHGAFALGYIIGPTISAQVQREYGFAPLFLVTAGFYTSAALVNALFFLRHSN